MTFSADGPNEGEWASRGRSGPWEPPDPAPAISRGPTAYRRSIRRIGPWMGLLIPAVGLLVAIAIFRAIPCQGRSCAVRHAPGWALSLTTVPTSVVSGLPWRGGIAVPIAMVTSALLWMALGKAAAKRATRSPCADWSDWRREYFWLAVPVWLGTIVGLGTLAAIVMFL